jgi:hypothetical protein
VIHVTFEQELFRFGTLISHRINHLGRVGHRILRCRGSRKKMSLHLVLAWKRNNSEKRLCQSPSIEAVSIANLVIIFIIKAVWRVKRPFWNGTCPHM